MRRDGAVLQVKGNEQLLVVFVFGWSECLINGRFQDQADQPGYFVVIPDRGNFRPAVLGALTLM